MKARNIVFIFFIFFVFGKIPIFAQEGRFLIMGDDRSTQLTWIDLHTGDQYFSLFGINLVQNRISNNNNYMVTVIYRGNKYNQVATVTLQPKGQNGDSISITYNDAGIVSLLQIMPK